MCDTPRMAKPEIDIKKLTREERLDLIEKLWDSLVSTTGDVPLTAAQEAELDRRIDDMDGDDFLGIPWETVLKQIRERQ